MMFYFLLILFISLLSSNISLTCDGETIDHCSKCGEGEDSDTCEICEPNYFPFLGNHFCIPCNDSTYGQTGCQGSCDASNFTQAKNVICKNETCLDGYYYLDGVCIPCNGCSKCIYEKISRKVRCLECGDSGDPNYNILLTPDGECHPCYIFSMCYQCHYNEFMNDTICDGGCLDGYYSKSERKCVNCRTKSIPYGSCRVCSDNDTEIDTCFCKKGSAYKGNLECVPCPDGCDSCFYNKLTHITECNGCNNRRFALKLDSKCTYCGYYCQNCDYDEDSNPYCKNCPLPYTLEKGHCFKCGEKCTKCTIDESKKYNNWEESIVCIECEQGYTLSPSGNCTPCDDPGTAGEGCGKCRYNKKAAKYECTECKNYEYYTFIKNKYMCIKNQNNLILQNCYSATYDEKNDKYECESCRNSYYFKIFQITNDKTCRSSYEIGLSTYCKQVENLGTIEKPLYSCLNQQEPYLVYLTNKSTGVKDYYMPENELLFCLEGTIELNGERKCNKCSEHASLNSSGICQCDSDSLQVNYFCHTCDSSNTGCDNSKGCLKNLTTNSFQCNQCQESYFKLYPSGACYSCLQYADNCQECHYESEDEDIYVNRLKIKCDKCLTMFSFSETGGKCELDECQEYPEISPGCMICKNNLGEYKSKNKCQFCKNGYFLTKEEKCVYCRSEKYGGPACYECGYGEGKENIICKDCYSFNDYKRTDYINSYKDGLFNAALNSEGKCYNYYYNNSEHCFKYEFIKDKDNKEKLTCVLCITGYYLNSEKKCISFIDKIEIIPNCFKHSFNIKELSFYFNYTSNDLDIHLNENSSKLYYDYTYYNKIVNNIINPINTICEQCQEGYFLNYKQECEILSLEKCTLNYYKNYSEQIENYCWRFCYDNNFPEIRLHIIDNYLDLEEENYKNISNIGNIQYPIELSSIIEGYYEIDEDTLDYIKDFPICYDISEEKLRNKFDNCDEVIYNPINKSYHCLHCENGYQYNYQKEKCVKENITPYKPCELENLGTNSTPIYSCKRCYLSNQVLVTYENGIKACVYNNTPALYNCNESIADNSYMYTLFNCTKCINKNYIPFYSKYYQMQICQNVYSEVIKKKNISLYKYKNETSIKADNKGICEKNYFTPDGENCYQCDNENVGMPGCKGECSFSLKRNNSLLCESGCKEGFMETFPGLCESCAKIEKGCNKCHYDKNYIHNDTYIKTFGRFYCESCDKGYVKSDNGTCIKCSDLFDKCEECEKDGSSFGYKCTKCSNFFALKNSTSCERCVITGAIINDKCVACGDSNKGGVDNCKYCREKGNEVLCKECNEGYILLRNNNTCLNIENNKELDQFNSCLELKRENNKYVCLKCKPRFSLLLTNNEYKCTYTPTLFDYNFKRHYYDHYFNNYYNEDIFGFRNFFENDYFYYRPNIYLPCKEAVNLGTNENPIYSCNKCYNVFDNEKYDYFIYNEFSDYIDYYTPIDFYFWNRNTKYFSDYKGYFPTKLIDKMVNNSYCVQPNKDLINCTEAIYYVSEGKEIFNCTKCFKDNALFSKINNTNIYYCKYNGTSNETENETDTEIEIDTEESKIETNIEIKNENNTEIIKETNVETNAEEKTTTNTESNTEANTKANTEANIESNIESNTEANTEANSQANTEANTKANTEAEIESTCTIEHCKTCNPNNIYFCSECDSSEYEINLITGSCVEKIEYIPSVIWKDIFGLILDSSKNINGRVIKGPSFFLRGITNNQINEGDAFIVFLIFSINQRLRNLQEVKIPAICEISKNIEENSDDINIVDYECIGNETVGSNMKLVGIEGDNINEDIEINSPTKKNSEYVTEDLPNVFVIEKNNLDKKIFNANPINFYLFGKIKERDELSDNKNISIEFNEINEKALCDFNKEKSNQEINANLSCSLKLANDSKDTDLSFKQNEIKLGDKYLYINSLNKIQFSYEADLTENSSQKRIYNRNDSSEHKTVIIVVSIIVSVVAIGGLIATLLCLTKKRKNTNIQNSAENSQGNTQISNIGLYK